MSFEQKINYHLNKFPAVKRIVKSIYQHGMYAVSKKIKSEGNITRISPNDNAHEYFFGYYDKSPWDISDRYMICIRAKDTWSDVSPKDVADILLIDTDKNENDPQRIRKIAETRAWNVQQSCMAQWLGPDYSSKIIYNDFRDGNYVAVILTLSTMEEKIISMPVYTVSSDGSFALTLDFSRLYNLRPGYGYYNVPESTEGIPLPDTTAVWKIDLISGEHTEILKYTDFASFEPRAEMKEKGSVHKVNHLMLSPNNERFMVLYRWFVGERKYTRLITCNCDGTDMYVLSDDDMVSHCFWKDDQHILAFENKKEYGTGYYLMTDKTNEYYHCWPEITGDGHPSYNVDRSCIVTDSYPDRARIQYIRIMRDENSKPEIVAKVFSPFKYDNDTRCDLHPRWNHGGDKICFDSVFEGHRGLYYASISKCEKQIEMNGKISVIIPVYNVEQYLTRCVESVMKQTYENLEIILVNDGSTDNSFELCKQLQKSYPKIIIVDKPNGGLSSARNAGIKASSGNYLAFLDSDDWVAPDCYEYMLRLLIANDSDIADVMPYQVKSDKDKVPLSNESINVYTGRQILEHYLYRGMSELNGAPYSVWRKLYKRELFQGDTAEFTGIVNEDICFNYRVLRKCKKIAVSNQIKYYYFQGESSITNGAMKKKDLALLDVSHELVELAEESGDHRIIELAKMKEARSDFSLLARAAKYGIDSKSISDSTNLIAELRKRLKHNLSLLIKSPMSLSRKALAISFAISFRFSKKIIKILHL